MEEVGTGGVLTSTKKWCHSDEECQVSCYKAMNAVLLIQQDFDLALDTYDIIDVKMLSVV